MIDVTLRLNKKERVLNALTGKDVDKPPVSNPTNVATVELMDYVNAPFPDACRDAELNARLAATEISEFGFDSIAPYFSIIQESSAIGCEMQWEQKDNWPTVRMSNPIWKTASDVKVPKDFLDHPDVRVIIDSIKILKKEFGEDVPIIGKTMGPWTLAYHVFGVATFLLGSVDNPSETIEALDKLTEFTYLFGEAQVDAGADVLTVPDHATGDLVSGQYYQKFLQDIHSEMAERFTVPLILHICGRTVDRMPFVAETGMHAFHFDSKNSPQEAMDAVNNKIALVGNINNPETLYSKDTDDVKKEVFECLNAGVQLIAPECAIPLKTKAENLIAITEGITDWLAETQK